MTSRKRQKRRQKQNRQSVSGVVGSWSFLLSLAFLILTIWPLLHLFLMNEIKEAQYRVDAIRNNITRIQQSIIEIDGEIARLSRADRIKHIAVHQLGMVDSQPIVDVIEVE
ncbi:MAG: hypothetical protein PWP06_78 [Candidatus Marinimicrobia bacterium]|jgi:cell division protein FtsL|nr:hypothetical protein [Candidatus Neomarinimicrobiota bacterium]